MNQKELAIHEAAHAVLTYRVGAKLCEAGVFISPTRGEAIISMRTVKSGEENAMINLAGPLGEFVFCSNPENPYGAGHDLRAVAEICRSNGYDEAKAAVLVRRTIEYLREDRTASAVKKVADALLAKGALNPDQTEALLADEISHWNLLKKTFRVVRSNTSTGNGEKREGTVEFAATASAVNGKSFTVIKQGDVIVDFQDVRIAGYLSTWEETTPADREGDYVMKGAFRETLPQFMRNPVVLTDHNQSVKMMVGRVTKAVEDSHGLYVEAEISNGQSDYLKQVRALVAEGMLKTFSMGGVFYYSAIDIQRIEKVDLFECTICSVPMNPDAIFTVR